MTSPTLAIDFGTSNSAAAILEDGKVRRLPLSDGLDTIPTAVFFPGDGGAMQIGDEAVASLIAGEDGRFMRALKSILGTSLFHERRLIEGKRRTLAEVVTAFLRILRERAEGASGHRFTHALSGRPVHFHSGDPDRDAQAEIDLRDCYLAAGFTSVDFLFEPEAAAFASHTLGRDRELGLIVDIGGGTSDFSVFEADGTTLNIIACHGLRLGGTDFDHAISMSHVMPLLGQGGELRRTLGSGLLPVPNAIYSELATWAKIPFLYTRETVRKVEDMVRHAVQPRAMQRLATVIEDELGHKLAFAVEKGKIKANNGQADAAVALGFIERALNAPVTAETLETALSEFRAKLREAMIDTITMADTTPDRIGSVILVGGSSLMTIVASEAQAVCPNATLAQSEAFTAVVDGLAIAAGKA